jgi:hypothetical protein
VLAAAVQLRRWLDCNDMNIRKSWRCRYDQAEFVSTGQKWLLMPKGVQAISSHANYS